MEQLLEYGVLGVCVLALSGIAYKFILVRLSTENDALRAEIIEVRKRYDTLLGQQLADYQSIVQSYAEIAARGRATISAATDVMTAMLEKVGDAGDDG